MSAPAHNPAPNSDGVIHLRPEIIIEPDYRYVQPNAARQSAATLSREQQVLAAYNLGKQHGPEGDNAMAGGGDSHKKDDHGDKKAVPEWATKWMAWAVVLIVLFIAGGMFLGKLESFFYPNAARDTERQAMLDRITAIENGTARGGGVGGAGNRVVGGGVAGGNAARGRVPTPEEVYQNELRAGRVKRTREPVDCVSTHWRADNSNRCVSIQWVPGED